MTRKALHLVCLFVGLYGGQVEEKGYAVVVVAEGAGEELLGENTTKDASG